MPFDMERNMYIWCTRSFETWSAGYFGTSAPPTHSEFYSDDPLPRRLSSMVPCVTCGYFTTPDIPMCSMCESRQNLRTRRCLHCGDYGEAMMWPPVFHEAGTVCYNCFYRNEVVADHRGCYAAWSDHGAQLPDSLCNDVPGYMAHREERDSYLLDEENNAIRERGIANISGEDRIGQVINLERIIDFLSECASGSYWRYWATYEQGQVLAIRDAFYEMRSIVRDMPGLSANSILLQTTWPIIEYLKFTLALRQATARVGHSGTMTGRCTTERARASETTGPVRINEYGYKPAPAFYTVPDQKPLDRPAPKRFYMGAELEVEAPSGGGSISTMLTESTVCANKFWYPKRDGSLSNGVELVSHPATWDYWRTMDFAPLQWLREHGYRSYNTTTCGLHVHVNRSAFTSGDIFKLLLLFQREQQFLWKLSGRRKGQLNMWARVYDPDYHKERYASRWPLSTDAYMARRAVFEGVGTDQETQMGSDYPDANDRRHAVNLCNAKTVEFRLFRGTLNPISIKTILAFVRTVAAFVQSHSYKEITAKRYRGWLNSEEASKIVGNKWTQLILGRIDRRAKEIAECV